MKQKETRSIRPVQFNMGSVIFIIIIIYVLFNIYSYFTKTEVAAYEVLPGKIATNYVYQGIVLREESVEIAPENGYVNYYMKSGTKASVYDLIYSIDKNGTIANAIANNIEFSQDISKESIANISKDIIDFYESYDSNRFYNNYDFFHSLESEIAYSVTSNAWEDLSDDISLALNNGTFIQYTSPEEGIIVYKTDSCEELTVQDVLKNGFQNVGYQPVHLTSNRPVEAGDPVYKRITSESWTVLLEIDSEIAKTLNDKSSVTIRFCKDGFQTNASCSVLKEKDVYYLKLDLKTGMIRYAEDRFLDVEIIMKSTSGLKIPVSSITSKEFFTVPKTFFTLETQELIVKYYEEEIEKTKRIKPTVYYASEDAYYIDSEYVKHGEIIIMPESLTTYVVGTDTDSLIGVYNINKGYAVFKQINILYQNDEYAIVETKTSYGISPYDHIALDAATVKENQLISK